MSPSTQLRRGLAAALAGGRGVVIAAVAHGQLGPRCVRDRARRELLVVTKHLSAASLDRFWQLTRARQGVNLTSGQGAMGRRARSCAGAGPPR